MKRYVANPQGTTWGDFISVLLLDKQLNNFISIEVLIQIHGINI
jgi:hypothetical protein